MTMPDRSPEELLAIRAKLVELEFRAKSDAQLLERLQHHPLEVLREFGLDDAMVDEILPELSAENENALSGGWCDGITCIRTTCNFFTYNMPPPTPPHPTL